ncbi:MAG: hypothetical protein Q7U14_02770 [Lacisediminimonas sp.]|nr:hypothetical protein [Lacisediminimonas sp.]
MASPYSSSLSVWLLLAALLPGLAWAKDVQTTQGQDERALCLSALPNPDIQVSADTSQQPSMHLAPSATIPLLVGKDQVHGVYLGLTRAAFQLTVRISAREMALPGNRVCTSPIVQIALSFSQIDVTTASELALDRCAHEFVTSHELMHVHFHKEALNNTAASLQAELRKQYPPDFRKIESRASLQVKQEDASQLTAWRARELFSRLNTMHAQLDSPAEYAKAFDVCGGVIARLLPIRTRSGAKLAQGTVE